MRPIASCLAFAFATAVTSLALADPPAEGTWTSGTTEPPAAPPPASCAVDRHPGVTPDEADAVEQIVCGEVNEKLPASGRYRVRLGKLGARVVLTLASIADDGGTRTEKQLVLTGLDEVPVAAPRLVASMAEHKAVAETQDMTNIVGHEARVPKKRSSEVHALLGVIGVAMFAPESGTGAGALLGLSAGSETWSFVGDLRVAGGGAKQVALAGGVRHHFGVSDTTPFLGTGMAIEGAGVGRESAGGLAIYGELGLELLRTHQFGGSLSVRFDFPTFPLEGRGTREGYSPVVGTAFVMRF